MKPAFIYKNPLIKQTGLMFSPKTDKKSSVDKSTGKKWVILTHFPLFTKDVQSTVE